MRRAPSPYTRERWDRLRAARRRQKPWPEIRAAMDAAVDRGRTKEDPPDAR